MACAVQEVFNLVRQEKKKNIKESVLILIVTRSPDLTPLDFFLWSHLKKIVYATEPTSPEEVIGRMQGAVQTIDEPMVRRVRQNLILRAEACIEARGAHFEQLL